MIHIDSGQPEKGGCLPVSEEQPPRRGRGRLQPASQKIKDYQRAFWAVLWRKEDAPPFSAAGFFSPCGAGGARSIGAGVSSWGMPPVWSTRLPAKESIPPCAAPSWRRPIWPSLKNGLPSSNRPGGDRSPDARTRMLPAVPRAFHALALVFSPETGDRRPLVECHDRNSERGKVESGTEKQDGGPGRPAAAAGQTIKKAGGRERGV